MFSKKKIYAGSAVIRVDVVSEKGYRRGEGNSEW